jgi:UDPglucose 6-dehydrogenase
MKIGIIGKGVVGNAVFWGLESVGYKLSYYDKKEENSNMVDVLDTEIVFICVPTNSNTDGTCNISIVEDTVSQLSLLDYTGIIAIKSTVIPGTTEKLINKYPSRTICFVPEFLKELSAISDFVDNHDVLIVGTHDKTVYDTIVKCHSHLPNSTVQVTPTEAEIAKYFSNVYNSLRITFANGMFEVCRSLGADYQQVFNACIKRSTISPEYLRCSEHLRGFGGHCLPKDSQAFAILIKDLGLDHITLCDSIVIVNRHHLKDVK